MDLAHGRRPGGRDGPARSIEAPGHELTVVAARRSRSGWRPTRPGWSRSLANLLNNAAKYTEPGGRIRLTAEREGGEVVVRVRDTGIGIAPEMLPRIFDLFAQADRRLRPLAGRPGHRADLVKSLVEMHGGTRRRPTATGRARAASSSSGCPPSPAPASAGTAGRAGAGTAAGRRRRAAASWSWTTTRTPPTAWPCCCAAVRATRSGSPTTARRRWTAAEAFRPEVVLLDIGLPGMDGYEVARRLRERPEFERTLLVALTGWGQEADRRRSREAGFDHHLVKPANPEAILELLIKNGKGE